MTLEQVYQVFKAFADNHLQIKSFGYGLEDNITIPELALYEVVSGQTVEAVEYPILYIVPVSRQISNTVLLYNFTVIAADRANKDGRDRIHIESDTLQYLLDFFAYLEQYQNGFTLNKQITIQPFIGQYADYLIGNEADFTIRTPYDFNSCQIPVIA